MGLLTLIAGPRFEDDTVVFKIKVKSNGGSSAFCKIYGYWKFKSDWRWKSLGNIAEDGMEYKKYMPARADKYLNICQKLWLEGKTNPFLREVPIRNLIQQGAIE